MSPLIWFLLASIAIEDCSGISFNRPKFGSCVTWNASAITVANQRLTGLHPTGIFITKKNNIYVSDRENNSVLVWYNQSLIPTRAIWQNLSEPWSLFVTNDTDIYIDNGYENGRVDKWALHGTASKPVMNVTSSCTGLFVDETDDLYCSSAVEHRVYKLDRHGHTNPVTVVAGTGCPGPMANMLDHPHGVFVDENLTLFVADSHNNRIQHFEPGERNGMTVAGFGALTMVILNRPTSVTIDGSGNLYVVDSGNHRIVRFVGAKFECLFGCDDSSGSTVRQLNNPYAMAFDTDGNILVTDLDNHRIQKFSLVCKLCVSTSTNTTTISNTSDSLPSQCLNYQLITDGTRHHTYHLLDKRCDHDDPMTPSGAWFRFCGDAGTMLANFKVKRHQCGTSYPGWFQGTFPTKPGSSTSGVVSYDSGTIVRTVSNNVSVTLCDSYYVFFLSSLSSLPFPLLHSLVFVISCCGIIF